MTIRLVQPSLPPPVDHRERVAEDVGRLFDYLVAHSSGLTYVDAASRFGWSRRYFLEMARQLRLMFAGDDVVLVCERNPDAKRGPWIYSLSDDIRLWIADRVQQLDSQSQTMEAVARSAVKATDGRTLLGKLARVYARQLRHLNEVIAALRDEQAM